MENIADDSNCQHCHTELNNDMYDWLIVMVIVVKLQMSYCRHIPYHHSLKSNSQTISI